MIKKIYTFLTLAMLAVIIFHGFYMFLGLFEVVSYNENTAAICGTILTLFVGLHGIYGLAKLAVILVQKNRMNSQIIRKQLPLNLGGIKATMLQRITGIVVFIMFVPHGFISLKSAPTVLIVLDYVYLGAIFVHLTCGLPKLFISMGIVDKRLEKRFAGVYGGGKKR